MSSQLLASRTALSVALLTLMTQFSPSAQAEDFSCVSDGSNFNWMTAGNWNTCNGVFPNNSGTIYDATINAGTVTLNSAVEIEDLFLDGGNLTHSANTFRVTNQATIGNGSTYLLSGGRVQGGTWDNTGTGSFIVGNSSNNFFDNVTFNGAIDMSAASRLRVENNFTLNGQIDVDGGGDLISNGSNAFDGSGTIAFGPGTSDFYLDGAGTTTIGSNFVIRGENGTIGNQLLIGGTQTLVVDGRISADVSGGVITIADSDVTNNGLLEAQNGGQLTLSSDVMQSASGQILAGNGSEVRQNGVTIAGGVLATAGSGVITASNSNSNVMDDVVVNGNIDLTTLGRIQFANNLELNGQIDLDGGSDVISNNTNQFSGNGSIVFGGVGGNNLYLDGAGTTTLGSDFVVSGENGVIGRQSLVAGIQTLVVDGRISANVSGGVIEIDDSDVINNGVLEAQNGGQLTLTSDVMSNVGGQIIAGAGSTVLQNGVTLSGNINASGTGTFRASNSNSNFLDAVTLNGDLDLASALGREQVINDLTLNGEITLNGGSDIFSVDNNVFDGNGSIVFGDNGVTGNNFYLDGDGTTTLESDFAVRGENGTIGLQAINGGIQTLVVNGRVSADVAGGNIVIAESAVTNNNILEAQNGGELTLRSAVANGPAGQILIGNNSTVLQSSTSITGGTITTTGSGVLRTNNAHTNVLNGVAVNGTVDMESALSIVHIINDLALNGEINVNSGSDVFSDDNNVFSGSGSLVFGDDGGNNFYLDGDGTTTLGANFTVRGENGTIGAQAVSGGVQILENLGTVSADVSGGIINIVQSDVTNSNLLEAQNGGQLTLSSAVTNIAGGQILAGNGSTVLQSAATISGGQINTAGTGVLRATNSHANVLDGVTINGTVDMDSGVSIEHVINDLVLNGQINLGSLSDIYSDGTNTFGGNGTIALDGSAGKNLYLEGDGVTTIGANFVIRGEDGTIGNQALVGGIQTLSVDGLVTVDVDTGVITLSQSDVDVNASGTLRAENGGTLAVNVAVDNQGLVEALDNSAVTYSTQGVTSNNMAGDLVGGVWRAEESGNGATITLRGDDIETNSADVTLKGANALIQVASTSIEDTLHTSNGSLRLQDGQNFNATANSGDFTNNGLLEVTDATFESNTLAHDGTINSFGNSSIVSTSGARIAGTGDINSSFGALTISNGLDITGILTTNGTLPTAGSVDLTGSPGGDSTVGTLANNGALVLGGDDLLVLNDYTNDNFGTGNSFDKRANVSGAGQLVGVDASQAVTGDVTSGGPNVVNIDFGGVRGGTTQTVNYQIANDGTGADIRGAVQTAAGGGNITDARLSGTGVTAANFGPIAAGNDSGNLAVTFDATTGGALTGQTVAVVSNFDNVATDIITLSGVATTLAQGSATPNSDPVDLGNFRVGSAPAAQNFAVENTSAANASTERLGIASLNTSGNFAAMSNLGGGFIAGGATSAAAFTASVDSGAAGVNMGSVTVQYNTNGELIEAAFTSIAANDETINLQATGFNVAVGAATPAPASLGNARVGGMLGQQFTVANNAAGGAFGEDLNASFGTDTGDATNNGGSLSGLLAGTSNASNMTAGLDTSTSGAKSGSVTFDYETAGEVGGVSNGLGTAAAGSQTVTLSGNVYQVAEGTLNGATSLNFGTVQVGQSVSQVLSLLNSATGAAGFVEDLNVAFGAATGTGNNLISGAGSISGLTAGSTDNSSMTVNVNTGVAGSINGQIAINYESAGAVGGVSNGLGTLPIGGDGFPVIGTIETNGQVVDQALPVINNGPFNFGNLRIGATMPTANVDVTNMATGNDQAALDASIAGNGSVTASGSFDNLLAGSSDTTSLQVGVNTGAAGAINDTATISFVSDASNIGNCAPNCELNIASQDVNVSANVYRLADPQLNTTDITLAARVGDAAPTMNVSVTNASPDAFTEALDGTFGATSAGFSASGSIDDLAAQGTDSSSMSVGLASTGAAQNISGTAVVNFESSGAGTTGEANISVGSQIVNLVGKVYEAAEAAVTSVVIDFGTVREGDTAAITEQISNVASGVLVDDLIGNFDPAPSPFSADAGDLTTGGVASGASGDLAFALDTSNSGVFAEDVVLNLQSHNDDLVDLGLDGIQFGLTGTVNALANPTYELDGGDATLSGGGNLYDLVFDTVVDGANTVLTADLSVLNDVLGPADSLDGLFNITGTGVFDALGFSMINDLVAGGIQSGFQVSFDTSLFGPGMFMGEILLNPTSVFAGLLDIDLDQITLRLSGRILPDGGNVPIPGTLLLILGPALLLVYRRGRRRYA